MIKGLLHYKLFCLFTQMNIRIKHILLDKTFLKIRTQFTQARLLPILVQFIHNLVSHHKITGLLPCNVHVNFNVVNA